MVFLLCNTTQVLFSEENKDNLKNCLKQPTFCHFTNQTRQQSFQLHSTQKGCEMNRLQTA